MEGDKLWNAFSWNHQANFLLSNLYRFNNEDKIILMIRHSEREQGSHEMKNHQLKLTSDGHIAAKIFGTKLPSNKRIRIFYSTVKRCVETANDILEGLSSIGGTVSNHGVKKVLYDIKLKPSFFKHELLKYTLSHIIHRWAAGLYSPQEITPARIYATNTAQEIILKSKENVKNSIDLFITHEVLLMLLRFMWFGLEGKSNWVSYLGGFAFSINESTIKLLDFEDFSEIDVPYWWNEYL
jgi:hypothetical protein